MFGVVTCVTVVTNLLVWNEGKGTQRSKGDSELVLRATPPGTLPSVLGMGPIQVPFALE